jgi:hypothetical protein
MLDPSQVTVRPLFPNKRMPLLVEAASSVPETKRFLADNLECLESLLLNHGAILFRGFNVSSIDHFAAVIEALKYRAMAYEYRSTPREKLGKTIYTASEYPAKRTIPLHCENAYQLDWPTRLLFACFQPSETGGQTPLADVLAVSNRLSPGCLDMFREHGVCYVRNYHGGLDLSWQNVFQTESKDEVGEICRRMNIEFEWVNDEQLRTKQIAQGVARHPLLGEMVFFNQAHLFHVSSLGADVVEMLVETVGFDNLPRHAFFGNMTEIAVSQLAEVRDAYEAEKIAFDWQRGDFVLIDNMQVAHGRTPYTGKRQVLASLCNRYSEARQHAAS